jgi:SAM-dependent methyltransferase
MIRSYVDEIEKIISTLNTKKSVWSYLTSIQYMLDSKLYMDSIYRCAIKASEKMGQDFSILDIGTGSGIFAILLRKLQENISISAIDTINDESQNDPNFSDTTQQQKLIWGHFSKKYNINFKHYDGAILPYSDNSFDAITACAVIEHIIPNKLPGVLSELKRVLKKNGKIYIYKFPRTLSYSERLAKLLGIGSHDILYSDKDIRKIFDKNGLEIAQEWRTDMVIDFPAKVTNPLYYPLKIIDKVLIKTPLSVFSHNNNYVLISKK